MEKNDLEFKKNIFFRIQQTLCVIFRNIKIEIKIVKITPKIGKNTDSVFLKLLIWGSIDFFAGFGLWFWFPSKYKISSQSENEILEKFSFADLISDFVSIICS